MKALADSHIALTAALSETGDTTRGRRQLPRSAAGQATDRHRQPSLIATTVCACAGTAIGRNSGRGARWSTGPSHVTNRFDQAPAPGAALVFSIKHTAWCVLLSIRTSPISSWQSCSSPAACVLLLSTSGPHCSSFPVPSFIGKRHVTATAGKVTVSLPHLRPSSLALRRPSRLLRPSTLAVGLAELPPLAPWTWMTPATLLTRRRSSVVYLRCHVPVSKLVWMVIPSLVC